MNTLTNNILDELKILSYDELKDIVDKVDIIEDSIDKTTQELTVNQLKRLKEKVCTAENSVIFTKMLTDFERIGDHGLNIAKNFSKLEGTVTAMKMIEV